MKSDYVYCRGKFFFIRGFIYPFIIAIWLVLKRYDIVVVHDQAGYGYSFVPKFMRGKMIAMCQGVWTDFGEMVRLTRFQRVKTWFAIRMQRGMINRCEYVMAYCNYVRDRLIKDYGTDPAKIEVVYNGVDTKAFKSKVSRNKKIAIWVGDNPKLKNLDRTIEYTRKNKMRLLVVGVNGKNTQDIIYMDKVGHEKMPEVYNKAGTFVMFLDVSAPSLVLLEAMACGLNIVTKETEILPPPKHGVCKVDGKLSRKIALKFDWKDVAERHLNIYKKVFEREQPKNDDKIQHKNRI
ncbi:MAG: glycosyltransferase family 4 protein [Nanoarchaeota archaeon]